jgi:hypothetical protein
MIPAFLLALVLGCSAAIRRIWRNRQDGYDYWYWLQ